MFAVKIYTNGGLPSRAERTGALNNSHFQPKPPRFFLNRKGLLSARIASRLGPLCGPTLRVTTEL